MLTKRVPLLLLLWLGGAWPTVAQTMQDVLTLKNGWQLRGRVTTTPDSVRITVYGGSRFGFGRAEVLQLTQERFVSPAIRYRARGFVQFTELGPLAAGNRASNGTTTSAFSLQTVNGYKFSQWVFLGVGAGVDLYAVQTFVPVFVSLRGDLSRRAPRIPFYFLDGGYGLNATTNDVPGAVFGGGPMGAAGLGLKILFEGNTGFILSAGYRFQQTTLTTAGLGPQRNTFVRVALRAGFTF
jgi:hypothetical protein